MRKLGKKQHEYTVSQLSKSAANLYRHIREGRFYKAYRGEPTKAMKELIDARLVFPGGRVVVIGSYYVPHDYKSFEFETWEGKKG